jgi:DnaJ-class molecular chaperone
MSTCTRCDGVGTILCHACDLKRPVNIFLLSSIGDADCARCTGSGEIICPSCEGSGDNSTSESCNVDFRFKKGA